MNIKLKIIFVFFLYLIYYPLELRANETELFYSKILDSDSVSTKNYNYYKGKIDESMVSKPNLNRINLGNEIIIINSVKNPFCFCVGKKIFGFRVGYWKFYCEGNLIQIRIYRPFRRIVVFHNDYFNYGHIN